MSAVTGAGDRGAFDTVVSKRIDMGYKGRMKPVLIFLARFVMVFLTVGFLTSMLFIGQRASIGEMIFAVLAVVVIATVVARQMGLESAEPKA